MLRETRLFPGIEAVVRRLAEGGAALSVLTNKPRRFTLAILDGLGVAGLFGAIVCGDDDMPPKPAPDGVLALVRASGIPPSRSLLVGDSVEDVETARAAGIASCAVAWGFRPLAELAAAGPDHVALAPEDLLAVVAGG